MHLRRIRWGAALAAGVLAALATSGCSKLSTPDGDRMDAISVEIQNELLQRPDVVKAEVFYQDNVEASGTASVSITVKPGADFDPIVDETLRLIWQSKLGRLVVISVDLVDADDIHRSISRSVILPEQKAELERQYGPRPAQ